MFGIGGTELAIIALFVLLIFGPDKLPQLARTVGQIVRDFKHYQDMMEATIRAEMNRAEEGEATPEIPAAAVTTAPTAEVVTDESDEEEDEE